jgi:hypothetical protein
MNWTDHQRSIAHEYCGTVLMLDDEIFKSSEVGTQIDPLFYNAKKAFESQGMLCDLRQIDHDFSSDDGIKLVLKQLRIADTIVVDWFLGHGKAEAEDPSNAIQVLKELVSIDGFRFAVVHTKATPERVIKRLKAEFPGTFQSLQLQNAAVPADDETSPIISEDAAADQAPPTQSPSIYKLDKSVYLTIVPKPSPDASQTATVAALFAEGLRLVFPDHLHWAGLEFAVRLRSVLPALLAKLPALTDTALIFQSLTQEGENELASCITESLVQEMRELLSSSPLEAVTDHTLQTRLADQVEQNKSALKSAFSTENSHWESGWSSFNQLKLKLACAEDAERRFPAEYASYFPVKGNNSPSKIAGLDKQYSQLSRFIATAVDQAKDDIEKSHQMYAALREHLQCSKPNRLEPGVVLRRIQGEEGTEAGEFDKAEWLLCISPACDCARGQHSRQYLFVIGKELGEFTSMQTCFHTDGKIVNVKWERKRLFTNECLPTGPNRYQFFTRLHEPFLQKVCQQVWGHQTRVGVSTSDYLRKLRKE